MKVRGVINNPPLSGECRDCIAHRWAAMQIVALPDDLGGTAFAYRLHLPSPIVADGIAVKQRPSTATHPGATSAKNESRSITTTVDIPPGGAERLCASGAGLTSRFH